MKTQIPIGLPPGTRALKLERWLSTPASWILWIHTNDFIHGTFLRLYDDGMIERVTVRADVGDDIILIKPAD